MKMTQMADRPLTAAFRVLREALSDVWADLWMALVLDFFWLLAQLLVIPGPPATLALFAVANRRARGDLAPGLPEFWSALRRYWAPAWRWGLLNLAVLFFLFGDIYLTGQGTATVLTRWIQGFYLAAAAAWLLVQLYALPFLLEQEQPSVRTALRNGALLLVRSPLFSIVLGAGLLLICALGLVAFLLTLGFGGMFVAAAANRAVLYHLGRD